MVDTYRRLSDEELAAQTRQSTAEEQEIADRQAAEQAEAQAAEETQARVQDAVAAQNGQAAETPEDDAVNMPLPDEFFEEKKGGVDAGKVIDAFTDPMKKAFTSNKPIDQAVFDMFLASFEGLGKALDTWAEQRKEKEKEFKKAAKENRIKFFRDSLSAKRDFAGIAAQSFQRWALKGLRYEGQTNLGAAERAALKRAQFIRDLPKTPDGKINWAGMKESERKTYAKSMEAYLNKSKEFKYLAARTLGMNLNKDEMKMVVQYAQGAHVTAPEVRGGMNAPQTTVDGNVIPTRAAQEHAAATAAHGARVASNTADGARIRNARDGARTPPIPTRERGGSGRE